MWTEYILPVSPHDPHYVVRGARLREQNICCGAEIWSQGVERMLRAYPQAKRPGLSAVSVRYLDNQRDIEEELFGGDVARKMSLGEAVMPGYKSAPKEESLRKTAQL